MPSFIRREYGRGFTGGLDENLMAKVIESDIPYLIKRSKDVGRTPGCGLRRISNRGGFDFPKFVRKVDVGLKKVNNPFLKPDAAVVKAESLVENATCIMEYLGVQA